jgi:S1-C subfamily serine protease
VGTAGGETVAATLVGRDPTTDLAVLHVEGADLAPPTWAEPDGLSVGHLVLGLGRPGRTVQATLGIVSALGEGWRTPAGGRVEPYLQTDLVMYPGFSGGPLVDVAGGVLGLNTSALLRGISLSVPTPTVRQVVETLLAHGRVRRGYLGVGAQPVRLPADLAEGVGQETGLLLVSVEPGAPADGAGLTLGDTIVALDGQPVRHMDELLALLGGDRVGASVPVGIVRGGQTQEMTVTIGERP